MTAFTVKKQAAAICAPTSGGPSNAFRLADQKLSQTTFSDTNVNGITIKSTSVVRSSVLSSLRRNYVSRGLRRLPLAEKTNRPEIVNSGPIPSTFKMPDTHPAEDHIRIAGARRSVKLLKFASNQPEESEMEDDTDDETVCSDDSMTCSESKEDSRNYSIKFQCYVKVCEIPNRHTYSSKQRKRMWNDSKSIRANAKRNRTEYYWEGRDWQNAPEEHDFFTLQNGMKVHPASFP